MVLKAQIGYNYDQYEFGFSAGYNKAYTDFKDSKPAYAAMVNFTYNATPYLNYIAEVQYGTLAARHLNYFPDADINFENKYNIVSFRAQLQMGELLNYSDSQFKNFLKNIYLSGGVGVAYTNLNVVDEGESSEDNKGSTAFIPLKAGYELKFFNSYGEPKVKFDIGYQFNYMLSDNFDGFPAGKTDVFTQIVVGLKVGIGGTTSYRKSISY